MMMSDRSSWLSVLGCAGLFASGLAIGGWLAQGNPPRWMRWSKLGGSGLKEVAESDGDSELIGDGPGIELRRLRRVETILRDRITRVVIVLERTNKSHNYAAVLRSAEALGFQNVMLVSVKESVANLTAERTNIASKHHWEEDTREYGNHLAFARNAGNFLTIQEFSTSADCIAYLKSNGYDIWVTDLSQKAVPLDFHRKEQWTLPSKLAVVMGTEGTGISQIFVDAADLRVYLPMFGFADSFNLSVSTALVMQFLLHRFPELAGSITDQEARELREKWYIHMARDEKEKALFLQYVDNPPLPFRDQRRHDEHRGGHFPKKLKKKQNANAIEEYHPGR